MSKYWLVWVVLVGLMVAGGMEARSATGATARVATGQLAQHTEPEHERQPVVVEPLETLTWLQLLRKGGPVMFPLYLCSIVVVAVAIERARGLRRKNILPQNLVDRLQCVARATAGELDTQKLLLEFKEQDSPLARIVTAGLRRAERPLPEIEKAIEDAGEKEADGLRRNCRILSIVATVAPLLGLLGTVTGMVRAFMTVAAREEALGRTELLAAGIYEALITTVVGLVIAIPTLVLYHLFVDRVHRLVLEIDQLTTNLVETMHEKQRGA